MRKLGRFWRYFPGHSRGWFLRKGLATFVTGCLYTLSQHSSSLAADLLQIYQQAQTNDASLQSARAQLEATREKIPQAKAALLPLVTGQALRSEETSETVIGCNTNTLTRRNTSPRSITLSLTQPLYRPILLENLAQSELQVQQAGLQWQLAQQDLLLRVTVAYFDILAVQDTLRVLAQQKTAIREQLELAKKSFVVGTATVTDQQEAQSRFDLVVSQEIAAQNDLINKRAVLENIIGGSLPDLAGMNLDTSISAPNPEQLQHWLDAAENNNLQILIADITRQIAKREVRKNRLGHYPSLDLTAQASDSQQSTFTGGSQNTVKSETSSFGLSLAVPIYSGGGVNSRVRETAQLLNKTESDLELAKRNAALSTKQSYAAVMNGLAQVTALKAAEKSSELALRSNQLGYKVGARINIDVLNAQQQLFTTQRDLLKAKYDTVVNGMRLRFATGTLSIEALTDVNRTLGQ